VCCKRTDDEEIFKKKEKNEKKIKQDFLPIDIIKIGDHKYSA